MLFIEGNEIKAIRLLSQLRDTSDDLAFQNHNFLQSLGWLSGLSQMSALATPLTPALIGYFSCGQPTSKQAHTSKDSCPPA